MTKALRLRKAHTKSRYMALLRLSAWEAVMREDMFKVIVERPRQSWGKPLKTKIRYVKDGRHRITGRRIACEHGDQKWLNENLAPLKRYLFKQRGRKWDDVFSEICARLDTGSTVKMHVREHIDDFIIRKIRIDSDGSFLSVGDWSQNLVKPDQWRADLYVCPYDGCIKETKVLCQSLGLERRHPYRRKPYTPPKTIKELSATHFLLQRKGLWFEIKIDQEPRFSSRFEVPLHVLAEFLFDEKIERVGKQYQKMLADKHWSVIFKKQLSKAQLKKHGLKNGGENA